MSSYRVVLLFIPNYLIACIIRPVGITNSRHVTEGDGLEPIRDIATVGRAYYLHRCGGIATACVWAVFGLFAL